jgi:hypothetical protein
LEHDVGNSAFLKIALMMGVMRLEEEGEVGIQDCLTPDLVGTHDIFHMSMLRKYITNPNAVMEYEPLEIQEGLTYVEEPVKIMDRKEQVLCTKTIPIIKVLSRNHGVEEASWETKHDMRSCYPYLFK